MLGDLVNAGLGDLMGLVRHRQVSELGGVGERKYFPFSKPRHLTPP